MRTAHSEEELLAHSNRRVVELTSWEAICKYYKAEGECYFALMK